MFSGWVDLDIMWERWGAGRGGRWHCLTVCVYVWYLEWKAFILLLYFIFIKEPIKVSDHLQMTVKKKYLGYLVVKKGGKRKTKREWGQLVKGWEGRRKKKKISHFFFELSSFDPDILKKFSFQALCVRLVTAERPEKENLHKELEKANRLNW